MAHGEDMIPRGTSITFVCTEGTNMIMQGNYPGSTLKVKVEVKKGWRIEKKIDFDRLNKEAAEHGSQL
jgi:hypothetical protein